MKKETLSAVSFTVLALCSWINSRELVAQEISKVAGVLSFRCEVAGKDEVVQMPGYVYEYHLYSNVWGFGTVELIPLENGTYAIYRCETGTSSSGGGWWKKTYKDGHSETGQVQQQQQAQQPSETCIDMAASATPSRSLDEAVAEARRSLEEEHGNSCGVQFSTPPRFSVQARYEQRQQQQQAQQYQQPQRQQQTQ